MARFIALLLIGPWLVVLGWLYWLYVRKSHVTTQMARHDALILAFGFLAAIVGAGIAWQVTLGHGGPIWKYLAGPLGAYAGFSVVLLFGLLRHWARRGSREMPVAPRADERPH